MSPQTPKSDPGTSQLASAPEQFRLSDIKQTAVPVRI